jgi:hypothetical protein
MHIKWLGAAYKRCASTAPPDPLDPTVGRAATQAKGPTPVEFHLTLPGRSFVGLYLDLYASGHGCEEFWWVLTRVVTARFRCRLRFGASQL